MITADFRPKKFSEVFHQELPKKVLSAIAKNPEDKPQSILLSGVYGSGKTTLARIFVKALNCVNHDGEVCGKCVSCKLPVEQDSLYLEYDSSIIGNVASIRRLRDEFGYSVLRGYKTVVLDECQVISKEAQSALLHSTEQPPKNLFFIFATTDPESVLEPLRSRCLELELTVAPPSVAFSRIAFLSQKLGIEISENVRNVIVSRAQGHFRSIDMYFDLLRMIGEKEFEASVKSTKPIIRSLVIAALSKNKEAFGKELEGLILNPLAYLRSDFEEFLSDIGEGFFNGGDLEKKLGMKVFSLIKYSLSSWGVGAFRNEKTLLAFWWSVFALLSQ